MFRPGEHGDEAGRLFQQGAQSLELLRCAAPTLFDRFGAADHARRVALLDLGDLNRVLEDVLDRPAVVEDRHLGRAPDVRVHTARGVGNIVFEMGDLVRFARL